MTQENRREAAVSETVGYILLFAIVTLSMGIIYVVGYPVLQSNIDANVFEGAEQSFIVLQSNMNRVAFDQTPVKELKINLMASSISVAQDSNIVIQYGTNPSEIINTGEILFEKDGKIISYETGSVFKNYGREGTVMVSEPSIYTTAIDGTNVTTIGLISVNGNDFISGKGITTLTLKHNSSTLEKSTDKTTVNIQVNSINAEKWEQYLDEIGFTITNSTTSSVSASKSDTMVIISKHVVDVEID